MNTRPKLEDLKGVFARSAILVEDNERFIYGLIKNASTYLPNFAITIVKDIQSLEKQDKIYDTAIVDPGLNKGTQSFEERLKVIHKASSFTLPNTKKIILTSNFSENEKSAAEQLCWQYIPKDIETMGRLVQIMDNAFHNIEVRFIDFDQHHDLPYFSILTFKENSVLKAYVQNRDKRPNLVAQSIEINAREYTNIIHSVARKIQGHNRRNFKNGCL